MFLSGKTPHLLKKSYLTKQLNILSTVNNFLVCLGLPSRWLVGLPQEIPDDVGCKLSNEHSIAMACACYCSASCVNLQKW